MTYRRFLAFNVIGAAAWVGSLAYAGYLFGNIPWVKDNLAWIVLGNVIVTLTPMMIEFIRDRLARRAADGERQP